MLTKDDLARKTKMIGPIFLKIILREGKNIRYAECAAVYLTITNLKRIRIGNITLKDIKQENIDSLPTPRSPHCK